MKIIIACKLLLRESLKNNLPILSVSFAPLLRSSYPHYARHNSGLSALQKTKIILLSLGTLFISGSLTLPFLIIFSSCGQKNEISPLINLYTLNIDYMDIILANEKVEMTLREEFNNEENSYDGKIERRGGYSIVYPKHSYEIDLVADVSIANLPADDDWILNANYIDKTFLRHVISYELFHEMHTNNRASKCKYVELKLNDSYNGLYVLMEKLDRSSLRVNKHDSSAVIFKEPHIFRPEYDNVIPQDPDNFHQQKFPKIEDNDKTYFIEEIRDFILNSSDSIFNEEIGNAFDIQSVIDWNLLLLITNNSDGILKNFYLYKIDTNTPLRIAPWDYDHSFGRDGDNELNLVNPLDLNRSILFLRLLKLEWYKTKLKARWTELNDLNLLSSTGLKNRIAMKKMAIENLANKNFELWPVNSQWYYDENNFGAEIQIMYQFIDIRHEQLSDYFNSF